MHAPTTIAEFLELGQKSGLLDKAGIDNYVEKKRATDSLPSTPKRLAGVMVRDGLLTPFQAQMLLQGKWKGFTIAGKYRVLGYLGAGGMGTVFLCEHTIMRRRVAVKVLPDSRLKDPAGLERFHREARAAAALDDPHIVHAHDVGSDGKIHFLVMEYIDGRRLDKVVKKEGPLPVGRAARYIAGAACGLQHAHAAGLVHRDIKPANLLIDRSDTVKVLDMGLARFFQDDSDSLTREHDSDAVLGTAGFLAPEQAANSHDADIRADLYSLGVTFYYLLTGTTPFTGDTVYQKLVGPMLWEPRPIRELRPEVPEELAAVIAKMMAKDRAARYQTPSEVVAALTPWVQSPPAPDTGDAGGKPAPTLVRPTSSDLAPTMPIVSSRAVTPAVPQTAEATSESPGLVTGSPPGPSQGEAAHRPRLSALVRVARVPRRWDVAAAAAAVAILLLIAAVVIFSFAAGRGTLDVEIAAADIRLTVLGEGQEILLTGAQPRQQLALKPGQYQIQPSPGDGRIRVTPEQFTLKRGERVALRAWRVEAPALPQAVAPLAIPQPTPPGSKAPDHPGLRLFRGHTAQVEAVAFAPDGRRALSAGHDRSLYLWEIPSGRLLRTLEGHWGAVWCVAFLPDGRRALSSSSDQTLRLWDLDSGRELRRFNGHGGEVRALALTADGSRVLSGSLDTTLRLWEVESGRELRRLEGHEKGVWGVDLSPDGRRALSGGMDKTLRLWNLEDGQQLRAFEGHTGEVRRVTFSPDGRRALSCSFDLTMRLWEVDSGRELKRFDGQPYYIESVAFASGGRYALTSEGYTTSTDPAVTGDRGIRLWDLETGKLQYRRGGVPDKVLQTVFSPDCRYALSACDDKIVRLWDLPRLPDSGSRQECTD
jgi:WD40 repeat protein/serine/threonine protein kinase